MANTIYVFCNIYNNLFFQLLIQINSPYLQSLKFYNQEAMDVAGSVWLFLCPFHKIYGGFAPCIHCNDVCEPSGKTLDNG